MIEDIYKLTEKKEKINEEEYIFIKEDEFLNSNSVFRESLHDWKKSEFERVIKIGKLEYNNEFEYYLTWSEGEKYPVLRRKKIQ